MIEVEYFFVERIKIGRIISNGLAFKNLQNSLDIMMGCKFDGCDRLIIEKSQIDHKFFDLKSGLAGEILQKFSTYGSKLAIIGDFSNHSSQSLKDFIRESNRVGRVNFVADYDAALLALKI